MKALTRLWYRLNYSYCLTNEYLSKQRGDIMQAVQDSRAASDWRFKYDHA